MRNLSQIIYKTILLLVSLIIISCSYAPQPFEMGKDVCEYCKMTIVDPKWGAQLITKTGKVFKYDAIECMILHGISLDPTNIHSRWTINFLHNEQFIKVEDAIYVRSLELNSPMGLNAISISKNEEINSLDLKNPSEKLNWNTLLNLVKKDFSVE